MKKIHYILFAIILFAAICYAEDTTYNDDKYGFSITYPVQYKALKNYQNFILTIFFPTTGFFDFFPANINIATKTVPPSTMPPEEMVEIYFKYSKSVIEKGNVTLSGIKFFYAIQAQKMRFFDIKQYLLIGIVRNKMYILAYTANVKDFDKNITEAKKIMHSIKFTSSPP